MIRIILLGILVAPLIRAESQPIANDTEWKDAAGETLLAQGGGILHIADTWWWYGVATDPGPDGNPLNHAVRCYSSVDLARWTPHGAIITDRVPFRVQAARSKAGELVLFLRDAVPSRDAAGKRLIRLAVAPKPTGPFAETAPLTIPDAADMGSFSVFQDEDGSACLFFSGASASNDTKREIYGVKLATDLRTTSGPATRVALMDGDEPRVWKRKGIYHLCTAKTQGWVSASPAYVTAPTLDGPWSQTQTPWRRGRREAFDSCLSCFDGVLEVTGSEGSLLIYYGSRYSQFSTYGVGRNIMIPWGTTPKDTVESPLWHQTWWLDAAKGTWSKKQSVTAVPEKR